MKSQLTLTALAALFFSSSAMCQDKMAQKYGATINKEDAYKHLSVLASDAYEGRETGKPGAMKAAEYIAAHFKSLGLKAPVNGSYFQDLKISELTPIPGNFTVNGNKYAFGTDYYFAASKNTFNGSIKDVVFAGLGIEAEQYNDLKGIDVKGKTVLLIAGPEPKANGQALTSGWNMNRRMKNLRDKGASLILIYNSIFDQAVKQALPRIQAGQLLLETKNVPAATAPAVQISERLANDILAKSGKKIADLQAAVNAATPGSFTVKTKGTFSVASRSTPMKASNVMGYLEGSDLKDEVLVFSAHYDHVGVHDGKVFNGADDDGSGTTGVLEIAEAFVKAKQEGHGPRRSILFLTVVGEEKGLLGSEWYSENPVFPMNKTVADLNIDMIGRVDPAHKDNPNYIYVIGSDKLSTDLHKISEYTNATYTRQNFDYKYNDPKDPERIYYRSDHYNFAKHGVPIVFYFNGTHEDYHKGTDEISKINFEMLTKRAQLVFYTGWDLANRDAAPVVDVKNDFPADR